MIKYLYIALFHIISITAIAQSMPFKGIVRETLSDSIISDAKITLLTHDKKYITQTKTDRSGMFTLDLNPGQYIIEITNTKRFVKLSHIIHIPEDLLSRKKIHEFRIFEISPKKQIPKTKKTKFIQIQGTIKDKNSNTPLSNIAIHIIDPKTKNIIKSYNTINGVFVFHLPPKDYGIKISSPEYYPVSKWIIPNKKTTTINIPTIYLELLYSKKINRGTGSDKEKYSKVVPKQITILEHISTSQKSKHPKTVNGLIIDAQTNEPISYAPIAVLDSINKFVKGGETNASGWFSLELTDGAYTLNVKMLGYKDLATKIKITDKNQTDSLTFKLDTDAILLSEAVVKAKIPSIQVKGDTLEYWAGAYTKDRDILLQDILSNIPGIHISPDGVLTINNKPVNKILIDGKEFFGNDIQLALKNIPSEMINKLHVYNKQSEMAELMGIKENSDNQVLDLELKDEYKKSIFGNIQAGYGSDDRYYHKFMVNKLSDDSQLTILGNMNNINNDEYGMGLDSDGPGLKKTKTIGANFNTEQIDDLDIESNITYNDDTELVKSNERTEYFISSGNRLEEETSKEETNNKSYKIETALEWNPKSNISAHLRIKGEHQDMKIYRESDLKSYVNKQDTTTENSTYSGTGYSDELSSVLTLGLNLNDKGRNLTFQLNGGFEKDSETGINQSETSYQNLYEKTLDQKIFDTGKGINWGGTISYTEPIGKDNTLYLSYSFNQNKADKDKNVFGTDDKDTYSIIDSTYTRKHKETNNNQILSLGFQSVKDKHEYSVNLNIEPSRDRSIINLGDSIIQNMKQSATNYNGSFKFTFKPQKSTIMNIMYYTMFSKPNTTQLSTDTTMIDTMNKTYGNPNLKGSLTNNLNLQYQRSDFETGRFYMLSGGLNFTTNQIAEYSSIDRQGNTEITYTNVNGNWGADVGFILSTPFKGEKFRLDNNTTTAYRRNTSYVNHEKSIINNLNINENLTFNYNSDIVKSNLRLDGSLNLTKNNLSDISNKKTINYGISNLTDLKLPFNLSFQNNIGYKHYIGYSQNSRKDELLWSASLSKLMFKEKGLFKIYVYDILNQKNNITSVQNSNQISDITTNAIKRYFLISFLYRFNIEN